MKPHSLMQQGRYSLNWVRDFYTQAGIWWGPDAQELAVIEANIATAVRLCGSAPMRVLELGASSGRFAAGMAARGHEVIAVELSPQRAAYARQTQAGASAPFEMIEGDFYTIDLPGRFDLICAWETFGLGSDADQRRLLRRMSADWLAPGGSVLMDVYSPVMLCRRAGEEDRLDPLEGVPGSVEMINRWYFDPLHSRWIDEWQPVARPDLALAQSVRCYSPADFLLLLEGTGLSLSRLEVAGQPLDLHAQQILTSGPLMDVFYYLVQLQAAQA